MTDEQYMERCLELAKKGIYTTPPNPMVGSVIVHDGKIIGEGYHIKAGQPHAEINAINSVKDKSLLQKSTLYVNLEPCSHYGKTPPCAVRIAELKIPRVVIGIKDFSAKVNGKGIQILKDAGIDVKVGVLEKESFWLNKRFFVNQKYKRPYIILKWAKTADGYIDYETKDTAKINWITDSFSKMKVHKWRAEETAVLAGKNTIIRDNPQLNIREWTSTKQPVKIILTHKTEGLNNNFKVFATGNKPLVIFSEHNNSELFEFVPVESRGLNLSGILVKLYKEHSIYSIIVEGGKQTLESFISNNLWDEARVFTGIKVKFNNGIPAPEFNFTPYKVELKDGVMLEWFYNDKNLSYENFTR